MHREGGFLVEWSFDFFRTSVLLGVGLAMDAFSVSLANGLNEPRMRRARMAEIAGMFAFFQFIMPLVGWVCVHTLVRYFSAFERLVPWIAMALLSYIGGKMLWEGLRGQAEDAPQAGVTFGALVVQGVATSIDALSVGFTIAEYGPAMAFACCAIIAGVTFAICVGGLKLGKTFGTKLAGKASILGGAILLFIGVKIFLDGLL